MGCKPCVFVHHYLILLHQGCGIRNAHAENRHQRRTAKTGEAAANRINCGRLCGSGAYDVRQGDSPYILRLAENDSSFYRLRRRSVSASVCDCEAGLQKSGKRRNKKEIIFFVWKAREAFTVSGSFFYRNIDLYSLCQVVLIE